MSPSQNPDFWRSQGGPANPPNAPKPGAGPAPAPGASAQTPQIPGAAKGNPPVNPESAAADKPKLEASTGGDPAAPSSGAGKEKNPQVPSSNTPASGDATAELGKPPATASLADKLGDKSTNYLNNKIDSIGSKKQDSLEAPDRYAPITSVGRDLEMSKEAVKGALGGAVKGAAKGAITGGAHGAAAGAVKQGVVSAAERINKTSATQRADQNRGPSNAGSLLDKAGSSASLEKSRMDTASRFGGGPEAAAGGGAGSALPPGADLTPEEAIAVAKAAVTVSNRLVIGVSKAVGISIVVVISMMLMLITSITGAIAPVAASAAAYSANSASCEAPKSTSGSGSSPGKVGSETGLKPAAVKTLRYINSKWGGKLTDIGGNREGGDAQDHATGNALDVMIPDYKSDTGKALGEEIANDLQKNASKMGITYIIWADKFWSSSGSGGSWTYAGDGKTYSGLDWAPYNSHGASGDTGLHYDHVHISMSDNPGEPLDAPTVSAASYIQSQLSPATANISFDRASVTTMLPAVDNPIASTGPAPSSMGLSSAEQVTNAKTIIGMAKTVGFGKEGALLAITVALDESTLMNLDHGDRDSLGLFQQRANWGSAADRQNPPYAAQAFFLGVGNVPGLQSIPNWKTMPVHQAAQAVQASGTPDGSNYLKDVPLATRVVDALYDSSDPVPAVKSGAINSPDGSANTSTSSNCGASTAGTTGSTAAGDTYPAKNESYCRTEACYAVQSVDGVAGGYRGECVDWASWKLVERTGTYGTYHVTALGNGGDWGDASVVRNNFPINMSPVAGDTVFFKMGKGGASSSAGHVATVQKVNGDGTVVVEEYNFGGDTPATGGGRYHTRTMNVNDASGYIHFFDPSKSEEENKANLISKGILVPGKTTWPR